MLQQEAALHVENYRYGSISYYFKIPYVPVTYRTYVQTYIEMNRVYRIEYGTVQLYGTVLNKYPVTRTSTVPVRYRTHRSSHRTICELHTRGEMMLKSNRMYSSLWLFCLLFICTKVEAAACSSCLQSCIVGKTLTALDESSSFKKYQHSATVTSRMMLKKHFSILVLGWNRLLRSPTHPSNNYRMQLCQFALYRFFSNSIVSRYLSSSHPGHNHGQLIKTLFCSSFPSENMNENEEIDQQQVENDNENKEESSNAVSWGMVATIGIYKNYISPLLPPACRFVPTCSQYGVQAIEEFGPTKGVVLTAWRLLRCSPFGGKGYDPPKWPPVSYNYASW